jgi:hypothetical protein
MSLKKKKGEKEKENKTLKILKIFAKKNASYKNHTYN